MKKYIVIFALIFMTVPFAFANDSENEIINSVSEEAVWSDEYQANETETPTMKKGRVVDSPNEDLPTSPVGSFVLPAIALMLAYGGYALRKKD